MRGLRISGFKWNPRTKVATFAVIVPGTKSRKRCRTTVQAFDRAEALDKWKEFRDKVLAGQNVIVQTFGDFIKKHWDASSKRLAPATARGERHILDRLLIPYFGERRLDRITSSTVGDFVAQMTAEEYAGSSVNGAIRILRKYLREAVDRDVIPYLAVKKFPHSAEAPVRNEMDEEERGKFLAAFSDEAGFRNLLAENRKEGKVIESPHFGFKARRFGGGRDPEGVAAGVHFERFASSKPVFVIALDTGLRRGDLLGLRWRNVHLDEGFIRLTMSKTRHEATIPISAACRKALLECKGRTVVSEEFVFTTADGCPYRVEKFRRFFAIAKKIAGINRRLRVHDLRHDLGSRLASKGVSIQQIARVLGHTSSRMAERYARVSDESLRAVRDALDADSVRAANSAANSGRVQVMAGMPLSSLVSMVRPTGFELVTFRSGEATSAPLTTVPVDSSEGCATSTNGNEEEKRPIEERCELRRELPNPSPRTAGPIDSPDGSESVETRIPRCDESDEPGGGVFE